MKSFYNLIIIFIFSTLVGCANKLSEDEKKLQELISRIENGLQSNVRIQYGDSVHIKTYNIEERIKELNIPGVSIAVLYKGELQWAKGYGFTDTSQTQKITTETLFQAGSISKPIAGTRALQLYEEGIIGLDTNINNYLKRWNVSDNEFTVKEKVTPRRILNHSASLAVRGFPGYSINDTVPDLLGVLKGEGNTGPIYVYDEPGKKVGYSGGGYTVLQLMLEDMEQGNFSQIMQEKILDPLGMNSSTYENPLPEKYHYKAASGHNSDGTVISGKWHTYPEMAAAGLWSTPSELLMWAHEMQQTLQTQKDGFLSTKTVNEMIKDYGNNQGLGPYTVEHVFGHGGSTEGFISDLRIWKDHPISVAIMVNCSRGNSFIQELFLGIAEEYNLPGIYHRLRKYNAQSKEELAQYEGTYEFSKDSRATIKVKDNGLEFTGGPASAPIYLLPEKDLTFFSVDTGLYFNFIREKDGITKMNIANYYKAIKVE